MTHSVKLFDGLYLEIAKRPFLVAAYFANCSRTDTVLRMAFVCPDLNYNLVPGINRVEWRVRLNDGSVTSKVVEWEIVQ